MTLADGGVMAGPLLAGSPPMTAIRYQIVVMFMLATATGSLLFVRLAARARLTSHCSMC